VIARHHEGQRCRGNSSWRDFDTVDLDVTAQYRKDGVNFGKSEERTGESPQDGNAQALNPESPNRRYEGGDCKVVANWRSPTKALGLLWFATIKGVPHGKNNE